MIPKDKHPAVILKDVTFKELKLMIQYMYCGSVDVIPEEIETFRKVLKSLEMDFDCDEFNENEKVEEDNEEVDDEDFFEIDTNETADIIDLEEPMWSDVKIKNEPQSDDESVVDEEDKPDSLMVASLLSKSLPDARRKFPIVIHNTTIDHKPSQSPKRLLISNQVSIQRRIMSNPSSQPQLRQNSSLFRQMTIDRVVPVKKLQQFMKVNPGKCPFCNKNFKTSKHRNEHVKYCFENPHRVISKCSLCQKSVCDPYYLRKHMRNVHGTSTTTRNN